MTSDKSSGAEAGLAAGDARSATQRPDIDSYVNLPKPAVDQTASLCRQLLTALQFLQLAGGADRSGNVDEESQTDSRKNPDVTERLRAENEHLRNKMKELVEMNVSWQKMHAEREKYVAELNRRLELTETTSTLPTDDLEQLQQRCSRLEEQTDMLRAERDELQSRLSESESLVEQLRRDVDSLETAAGDRQSTIEMLQMQVVIYREDFECERKDRERAQGQVVELTKTIEQMNRSRQQAEHRMPSTYAGDYNVQSSSVHPSHLNHYHRHNSSVVTPVANDIYHFIGRGDVYQIDGKDADDLATDGPEDDDAAAAAATAPLDANVLQCPKCLRGFTKDQHVELMDHIDDCV